MEHPCYRLKASEEGESLLLREVLCLQVLDRLIHLILWELLVEVDESWVDWSLNQL